MFLLLLIFSFVIIGVGFAIGGDSAVKYLVLQVHYANVNSLQGMSAPFDNNNNYNAVSDYITKQLLFF